ncbi:MAG TPA: trypsin-like peptidase domain-containing protein [Patescibacteria group bacterium]|nr:trypsin-like peptidase domain-containing protein [Patescibacteria group bacterium]
MAKNIRYIDDTGAEHPLSRARRPRGGLVVAAIILSFIMGILGGVVGLVLATSAPESVQKALGIDQLKTAVSDAVKTERIKVEEESATIDAAKKVAPAVVSITFTKDVNAINPFDFWGQGSQVIQQKGGGSGFIITADGLIATNKHVVSDTSAKYTVITNDGKTYDATVLAQDPALDFAVVKIDAKGLPVVELGSSDGLQVGQKVLAIGNALGEFQNTVTAGVLSALGRSIVASDISAQQSSESLDGLLQTDTAINTGNSGGPLVNLRGQVIGINTATAAKGQAEGIGFAIPIDMAKSAIESVKKSGKIIRAFLGVNTIELNKDIADKMQITTTEGFLIASDASQGIKGVVKGSPAEKAGLREGDVLTAVNDNKVNQSNSLITELRKFAPNEEVEIKFIRDGKEKTVKVKLGEREN